MPDRAFIDTNLLVYLYSASDKRKAETTIEALQSHECLLQHFKQDVISCCLKICQMAWLLRTR